MTSKEDPDTLLAPFYFTIFPITSYGVDAKVLIDFAKRSNPTAWKSGFTCSLTEILIAVLILEPGVPSVGNSKSVRKSKGGCKVRRHIDIVEWQAASVSKKKALLEDCVRASLASIPDKYLSAREKGELEDIAMRALYSGRKQ